MAKGKKTSKPSLWARMKKPFNKAAGDDTLRVILGVLTFFITIFLFLALLGFFKDGVKDASLYDTAASTINSETTQQQAQNIMGQAGSRSGHFLVAECFGIASFFLVFFLGTISLKLFGVKRISIWASFARFAVYTLWTSLALTTFEQLLVIDSFFHYGGQIGYNAYILTTQQIGVLGVIIFLVATALIYLVVDRKGAATGVLSYFGNSRLSKERVQKKTVVDEAAEEADEAASVEELVSEEVEMPVEDVPVVENEVDESFLSEEETDLITDEMTDSMLDVEPDIDTMPSLDSDLTETDFVIEDAVQEEMADEPSALVPVDEAEEDTGSEFVIEAPVEDETVDEVMAPYNPHLDLEHYKYPTLDLLKDFGDSMPVKNEEELKMNKDRIEQTLLEYDIRVSSIKATPGPTVTLYEITPAQGVRISKIRNLEDDIALRLQALGIRIIAPIPGKGTVGIEVPNSNPQIVSMRALMASKKYQESKMELPMAIGRTITNEVFMIDLHKMPHLLVAGATGQGKSVGLNAMITSLLYKKHPSEMKFVMVDPKKVEFSIYSVIEKHFLAKLPDAEEAIITDVTKVVQTLNSVCTEMDERYDLLKNAHCRNIKEYNEKFIDRKLNPENGHRFMPYIVVIIDEFGDLIMTAGKDIELPIARIAQLARAVGIHMIIATQRPTTNIITGTIKANFPARIAFKVSQMTDSRTILDRPGANQLVGRGDMLYLKEVEPIRVQCAFVDTPEVDEITKFINKQQGYPTAHILPEFVGEEGEKQDSSEVDMTRLDAIFEEAARMIVVHQQGSTSFIQRKFSIGYNRAGRLMDQMEVAGIVGPMDGQKGRKVLCADEMELQMRFDSLGIFPN